MPSIAEISQKFLYISEIQKQDLKFKDGFIVGRVIPQRFLSLLIGPNIASNFLFSLL